MAFKKHRQADVGRLRGYGTNAAVYLLTAVLMMQQVGTAQTLQEPAPQQQAPSPSQQQDTQQPNAQPATPADATQNAGQSSLPVFQAPQAPSSGQQTPPPPPANSQQPVGTAVAPYEKPTGVPGSRPAGAAIAPAKQKRVRAIVIRVGVLLAAGAAVGAVVGLSKASHSQPQ